MTDRERELYNILTKLGIATHAEIMHYYKGLGSWSDALNFLLKWRAGFDSLDAVDKAAAKA